METYSNSFSWIRLRLLCPRFLEILKETNQDWRELKNLKEWELVMKPSTRDEDEEFILEQEIPRKRGIWEILDWILWKKGNLVETDCGYPFLNLIWTKRPFEVVLEEVCLLAYTMQHEWLKRKHPILEEVFNEVRIYFMKLFVIKTSAYKEGAAPPSVEELNNWASSEWNSYIQANNLSYETFNAQ